MRSRLLLLLSPALVLLATQARGDPGDPGVEVIFPLDHDFVIETPPAVPPMHVIDAPYRFVVYLNFDGATLTAGQDDARTNKTGLVAGTLEYPAMAAWTKLGGRDKGIAAVVEELKLIFEKMAVDFVTTRPSSGDYTMAVIGGTGQGVQGGGEAVGISPLDCKNSNKNDIVLIFGDKIAGTAKENAFVIAHELGHSFGLEHVEDTKSIMYPALNGATCCWTTSAVEPPVICGRDPQDDERVLLDTLGGGPGDQVTPLCWFLRPGAGAVLPSSFSVEVSALDDKRIHHVALYLDGVKKVEVPSGPYAAFFSQVPDGQHLLRAEAADWKPNLTSVEITITVDAGCALKGTCSAGKSGPGAACSRSDECSSGMCARKDGAGSCALTCDPVANFCPAGQSCQPSGDASICTAGPGWEVEKPAGGEGGCALGSLGSGRRRAAALPLALLVLAGLGLLARRRSRPS